MRELRRFCLPNVYAGCPAKAAERGKSLSKRSRAQNKKRQKQEGRERQKQRNEQKSAKKSRAEHGIKR